MIGEGVYDVGSPEEMQRLGEMIAAGLGVGDVLMLHGDLGAGKTTLTQGIAAGLGVREPVQSPTFTLVREHRGRELTLYHLDLYRLVDPDELESLGYEVYLDPPDGVSVIEWPERAGDWLPESFTVVRIDHLGGDRRRVTIERIGA
ncbi:MAG TPA: tRNA (adenosine(37)-N6)-threonylcarbamoyltransferase complex ATPase subunit type 1 TsaE [Thermomicrobiales bacterium]|jgi:tRNA threonylcarbamoyladenosine biosynthesis protein TsaE|nr:tRNA (adenosine(37)-N6)-threonylcarbamoyltransferase complex ATPase subunit type 1 TsaE [Thermomicrobiales bacterium]